MTLITEGLPGHVYREIKAPTRILESGARGKTVERAQEWLTIHGFATEIDGQFSAATQRCVRDFQRKRRIEESGCIDVDTWTALTEPMRKALKAPRVAASSPYSGFVKAIAEQHVNRRPLEVGGANAGPWVRLYCSGNDGVDWLWCAGFVSFLLRHASAISGRKQPIAGSVSCDSLAAQAKQAGRFISGKSLRKSPERWAELGKSAIFLCRRTSTDWIHTGLLVDPASVPERDMTFVTVEGNTSSSGGRNGVEACCRVRNAASGNYDYIFLD